MAAGVCLGPGAAEAQESDWGTLPGGRLRIGISGDFVYADQRFGLREVGGATEEGLEGLAYDLRVANGGALFPGFPSLTSALQDVLSDPGYVPRLGASRAYIQASQVSVPFTLEIGATPWLTVGATLPLVKSRVEGDLSLIPTSVDDLGVNPAFSRFDQVQAFTDAVATAAAALPAGTADVWTAWAASWVQAYGSSPVFPAEGTPAAAALASAMAQFNAVLSAAGVAPVTSDVPLAEAVLTSETLREFLYDQEGRYQIIPIPTQLLWTLGDVEVHGRLQIVEGAPLESTGRPKFGLTALGTVVLPTGAGDETRAIFDIPAGEGHLGYRAGAAGWFRAGRLGLAAMGEYGIYQAADVPRRVAPPNLPLVPAVNLATVTRTPGKTLELQFRPSFSLAPALTVEGRYRYFRRDADTFENIEPPVAPAAGLPLPVGDIFADAAVLALETEQQLHVVGGGLRFHPPEGDFPVEAWVGVHSAIAGSGGQVLRETRLIFGGRAHWRLWGR